MQLNKLIMAKKHTNISDEQPDPTDYANGGRLMITGNTYRPHYFDDGSFMRGTMQTSIPIETAGINPQGVPNGNGTTPSGSGINWGNVGMGAAGAASGLMGQIGVSEKNPNGLWDAADPMHYLANGRTSKFGEGASKLGIGLTQAGLQSGNPWLAVAGAAVKIVGDLGNAGWGHKTDEEQLARINQGIDAANNFQSNANSFDELQNPMTLASAGNVYEGGWFNKKKWEKKNDELQANTAKAQANVYNQFSNNLNNLQQDQMNNMLANYAAFGGTLSTQGSDWRTGLTFVGNGGSHESNPYGGVPMGIAPDGQPNLVEEGEVIYDLNGSPYVYSKRLKMSQAFKDKYKFKGETFADAATQAEKEIEERPNDPIAKRGLDDMMGIIAGEQEKERQKRAERQARKQAKQAAYAYGGHMYEGGGLIFYNGKFYRDNGKGSYMPEDGKGSYLTTQDLKMLGNAVQYYNGDDFEVEEDWRERMSNPYPRQQAASTYTDPLDKISVINPTGESYSDYVNRMHTEAERNAAWNKGIGTGEPLTDQMAGNPYYGTAPSPLQQNSGWRSFLLPSYSAVTTPSASTTTTPTTTSTSTSKSTSTGKGTGTTGVKGNRAVDQADWADAKNWWLNTATDDEFNAVNALFNNRFKDRNALAAYAESGNIGRAYDAISKGYSNYANSIAASNQAKQADEAWNNYMSYVTSGNWQNPQVQTEPAATEVAEAAETKKEAEDVSNPIKHRRTWMRYAPVIGSALSVLTDPWLNKPDYRNADMVLEAGNSAKDVSFRPIGDYLPYKPYDRLFYANQLAANQAATRRALLNTTGGNASTARGLLLAADNQGINQMGNLWRQAEEYNEANRQAVADFNRGTNMFNSEGFLKADMANQGQGNVKINAAIEAAKLRELEDNRVAETRSANFTNLFNNLGNIGRENFVWNQVNENPALYYGVGRGGSTDYKGNSDGYDIFQQNMDRWNKEHTAALGGYITIK